MSRPISGKTPVFRRVEAVMPNSRQPRFQKRILRIQAKRAFTETAFWAGTFSLQMHTVSTQANMSLCV
jgi:hypothetical protein